MVKLELNQSETLLDTYAISVGRLWLKSQFVFLVSEESDAEEFF